MAEKNDVGVLKLSLSDIVETLAGFDGSIKDVLKKACFCEMDMKTVVKYTKLCNNGVNILKELKRQGIDIGDGEVGGCFNKLKSAHYLLGRFNNNWGSFDGDFSIVYKSEFPEAQAA